MDLNSKLRRMGLSTADIMIPINNTDFSKWAVVACDQYTSEKEYWESVRETVKDAPSTLNLIFPECYLDDGNTDKRINDINSSMKSYIDKNLFQTFENCFFLVKRTCKSGSRLGLMATLDLERYSWEKDSKSLIRATEGTILSRIPPRKKIREDAPLEIPHIMVLISDENKTVIEPLYAKNENLKKVYDFDLMKDSGHLEAWVVNSEEDKETIEKAFEKLYSSLDQKNPLLFAMGDGNHSFATAKSCWEDIKKNLSDEERENHPARFCLVELENIFDPGLMFEPINRVLFKVPERKFLKELSKQCSSFETTKVGCKNCIAKELAKEDIQKFGYCVKGNHYVVTMNNPSSNIAAGTIQKVIDALTEKGFKVDYIHGAEVTDNLGQEKGNIGIFLPAISKSTFFETIIKDGALPRKTFSMGEADEKRFYMECRKIK